MNRVITCIVAMIVSVAAGGVPAEAGPFVETPSGLQYKDLKVGTGKAAGYEDTVKIHFVGWIDKNGQPGKELYNTRREKRPVSFVVGTEYVMKGWNIGVVGMQSGGTRLLRIPPELGYGAKSVEGVVPPHTHLLFVVELLEVE